MTQALTAAQENLETFRAYSEEHNPLPYFTEDAEFFDMSRPEPLRGPQEIKVMLDTFYRTAFSNSGYRERNLMVSEDGKIALEFTFYGDHTGDLFGIPATGKHVEIPMTSVYEFEGGKIRTARLYYDTFTLMRQLGLLT